MPNNKTTLKFDNLSKSLDGNLIIGDHPRALLVISPAKRKLTIIAKDGYKEDFVGVQKRFLALAREKGFVVLGSESTGYLPGMFELTYPENPEKDSVKVMLKFMHMFVQKEKEIIGRIEKHEKDFETNILQPSDEESTELGEIPHKRKQGGQAQNPYMNYITSWFGWFM